MANEKKKRPKVNNNYYLSPFGENYLNKCALIANIIAIVSAALWLPSLVLFFAPGMQSVLWMIEANTAFVLYILLFFFVGIAQAVCAVMSFFGFKIRKEVKQKSGPTFGFARTSYNGILITAVFSTALLIFQIVILVGYHLALGNGYIEYIVGQYEAAADATLATDVIGIVMAVFYALNAAAAWTYYVYTYKVNRPMQLVCPDGEPNTKEEKKQKKEKEAEAAGRRHPFWLSREEKELGEREWADYEEPSEDEDGEDNGEPFEELSKSDDKKKKKK